MQCIYMWRTSMVSLTFTISTAWTNDTSTFCFITLCSYYLPKRMSCAFVPPLFYITGAERVVPGPHFTGNVCDWIFITTNLLSESTCQFVCCTQYQARFSQQGENAQLLRYAIEAFPASGHRDWGAVRRGKA